LQPWNFPEDAKWQIQYTQQQIKEFTEIVTLRQKINEEII